MKVLIDNRIKLELPEDYKQIFDKTVEQTLKYEGIDWQCEVSISVVDNKEIRRINKQFRNIDKVTDVLSFPQLTFEEGEKPDVNEDGEILLGDIIISIEKALDQAEEYGHSLKRELAFLTAHSMLHLLGYDHMETDEEEEMNKKQNEILIEAGYPRE